ncbi:Serine/threonine-protein kinase PknH [Crateriforma conspicua]|uniref:Serine/threonine-protein kinase PknH n=2 Tax=Crateriforma conspicua TaxID=2527996 RepID=A0A5C5YC07_9PLAN|nr:Serine/threonine-protein kinase PknH [Crateriforma conspicua]
MGTAMPPNSRVVYNDASSFTMPKRSDMSSLEFLGPYRVGELIGRGGMGSVYEATHEQTQEKVAVKLIASHVADEMRFRRRFAAEVEALKQLRHENIVRLIGYGEEQGQLFYAMELVDGESLRTIIRRQQRLPWIRAVDFAIQICSALKHAHDVGVIHRDLKPANLLVDRNDKIKMVDFGIAKLFGFGEQTMAGSVLGTADYMAPEQADSGSITIRTDLYALGSLIYAMLVGRPPFSDKSSTKVLESLRHETPVSLQSLDPNLPDDLVDLVDELLAKDPDDRPPTALKVGNRLKALRAGMLRDSTWNERGAATQLLTESEAKDFVAAHQAKADVDTSPAGTATGSIEPPGAPGSISGEDTGERHKDRTGESRSRNDVGTKANDKGSSPAKDPSNPGRSANMTVNVPPNQATEVSDQHGVVPDYPALNDASRTHFQTVDASKRSDDGQVHPDSTKPTWIHGLSLVGMIAILIGIGVYLFGTMRTPSADELFDEISRAESGNRLTSVEPRIRYFLNTYGDDPRREQVATWQLEMELQQVMNRLVFKVNHRGLEQLAPHEQTFFRAMQLRSDAPEQAGEQMSLWLTLFAGADTVQSDQVQQMTRLVRHELARLDAGESVESSDPRIHELMQRIYASRHKRSEQERKDMLNALIRLHENDPWAAPVVQRAREELQSIETTDAVPTAVDIQIGTDTEVQDTEVLRIDESDPEKSTE